MVIKIQIYIKTFHNPHHRKEINIKTVYMQRKGRLKNTNLYGICMGLFIKAHVSLANYIIK